jgi:Ca2+-binding RTX toxin-like protein
MVNFTIIPPNTVWPFDQGHDNSNNDDIVGSNQRDAIFGGLDDDKIDGKNADDFLYGEHGKDTMLGGGGNDYMDGGDDDDDMSGGANADWMFGGEGNDTMDGGNHQDTMFGGGMNDDMKGGLLGDRLYGNSGEDTLDGEEGNDQINGGADKDTLTGGPGNDTFVYTDPTDSTVTDFDEIQDFAAGDKIDLRPIDARANTPADDAFSGTLLTGAGAPATLAQARLYYDTTNNELYGNVTADTTPDFMIHVGFVGFDSGDLFL